MRSVWERFFVFNRLKTTEHGLSICLESRENDRSDTRRFHLYSFLERISFFVHN